MIEVRVEHSEPRTVAFVKMRGPYAQIPATFERLYRWAGAHSLTPVGMPRAVYLTDPAATPEAEATWEVQTDLDGSPEASGADANGVGVAVVGANDDACAMHRGPYETIDRTYAELAGWIAQHGYVVCGPPAEVYLSDPADTEPEDYLTQVRFPVRVAS